MKKLTLLVIILIAGKAYGQNSLMVEKHIFTPAETSPSETSSPTKPDNLFKNGAVQLTGILVTPKEKRAIFSLKEKSDKTKGRKTFREGDSVTDQVSLEMIGPNYVLVNQNGSQVRINLFSGDKNRPEPPVIAAGPPEASKKSEKGETPGASTELQSGTSGQNPVAPNPSPFGGGGKGMGARGVPGGKGSPVNSSGDGSPSATSGKPESMEPGETNNPAELFRKLTEQNIQRQPGAPDGAARNQLLEMFGGSKPN
jgi:hypothetical protein